MDIKTEIKKEDSDVIVENSCDPIQFLIKKTERITAAIYIVTNHMSDSEPLKWVMREKGLRSLSDIFLLRDIQVKDTIKDRLSLKIKSYVLETVFFLEVAMLSDLISKINFSILKKESDSLLELIEQKKLNTEDSSKSILPEDFFIVDDLRVPAEFAPRKAQEPVLYKKQNKMDNPTDELKNRQKFFMNSDMNSLNRREKILNIIKDKKVVMIKDISQSINGCSEKTVQRELVAMVKDNLLKKEGERRWSKYSLNLSL